MCSSLWLIYMFLFHTCCLAMDLTHHRRSTTGYLTSHRHHHGEILRRVNRESSPRVESVQWNSANNYYKSEDSSIGVRTNADNEHKPNFTHCKIFRPEVYENQPMNTSVIQVRAIDLDPENAGGNITYSIVETSDDFTVDTYTGLVRTNKIFDRDEPAREKLVYVSIRATDNGRPPLDDVCNLKVIIRDVNDNRPVFDKFEYRESIPWDMPVGGVVMRISATDIDDGNNGTVHYSLQAFPASPKDIEYFEITPENGEVRLRRRFQESRDSERTYTVVGVASDRGDPPELSFTNLSIRVVEPNQKPPFFLMEFPEPIRVKELSHDPSIPIVTLEANSGIANNSLVFFELLNGQTQPTNKDSIFTSEASGNKVSIKIEKQLDYEVVNEYLLTVRVTNKHDLAATTVLRVTVEDENDERPFFTDVKQGSVLENEPPGTLVMRVQAIDKDGTSPNNLVSYSLGPQYIDDFTIDPQTGEIRTNRSFDREMQDIFQLEVIARDGAPSAILKPNVQGLPNERREQIKIEMKDKNDNPPKFEDSKGGYRAEVLENADVGDIVIEVKATDPDTESVISYSIVEGDPDGHFTIRSTSQGGIISIQKSLDYEKIQSYRLKVKASDTLREVFTSVSVGVTNINDNPPAFEEMEKKVTIQEETVPPYCIFTVRAHDPDIGDHVQPQGIHYFVDKNAQESFSVDPITGCVRVKRPLDRDPPNGVPYYQAFIGAYDENGNTTTKLFSLLELIVNLADINDNHPILNSSNPVVWNENQGSGTITQLTAIDYDDVQNGPPFTFTMGRSAEEEVRRSFQVVGNTLRAIKENFDREERKSYTIPLEILDSGSPPQVGASYLTVIIGDMNDSPMRDGESEIFVYKYMEKNPVTIGRVYVEDLDDWDLPDKSFAWEDTPLSDFVLDYADGNIHMRPSAKEGIYKLKFKVTDNFRNEEAKAVVTVTVKQITDEAIDSSGSIRFYGLPKEEFVKPITPDGKSRKDILRAEISRILNVPEANVDVFTVINPYIANDVNIVDIRFSVHNSPYYKPEKLEGILGPHKERLEQLLNVDILMIRVDECIRENVNCEQSCVNRLTKNQISYKIFTNTSSFVGVDASVTPECICVENFRPFSCQPNPCLHNGVCHAGPNIDGFRCECPEGRQGERCEQTSIAFHGSNYAWFPPISVCSDSILDLHFNTGAMSGLLFYNGPTHLVPLNVTDFVSLELENGQPIFLLDFGSGVLRLELPGSPNLSDGKDHHVSLKWSPTEISMTVDDCVRREVGTCYTVGYKIGSHSYLNVNGPFQLGGISFSPRELQNSMNWTYIPTSLGFNGCISNVTLNGQAYDLGEPSFSIGNLTTCGLPVVAGVQIAKLGVGLNFIIILIVCVFVLLLLVVAVVFYRRRRKYEEVKGEPGDDVRENIINYSDEGGGEGDHAGYDLSVLMKAGNIPYISTPTDKILMESFHPHGQVPDHSPDMGTFLNDSKNRMDNDPEGLPFDDVRNYAYEGDGNSLGSLSSLASATDDEDMNFDFLPSFGPRFKKLADMYVGESSDDERGTLRPSGSSNAWC